MSIPPVNVGIGWLVGCLTARQHKKANLCQLWGEENRLRRLRMAREIQCIIPYVTRYKCNTVHSKTLQLHKLNNRLYNRMTYLLIMTLSPSPIPSQVLNTLFDIISLGVDAVSCHDTAGRETSSGG